MLKLGLIGRGISRTQVHKLHILLGKLVGIGVQYDLMDIPPAPDFDLRVHLERCARQAYSGVNVTHPFKLQAFACTTDHAWLPRELESVNTVVFHGDIWRGGNTDYSGFIAAYRATFGTQPPGRVLMAGAGGVGVSIALALAELGADSLAIYDIDTARAVGLAQQMRRVGLDAHPVLETGEALLREAADVDGLVNATPLGMYHYPGTAFPEACLAGQRWAFDAVYTPANTPFLAAATARGLAVMGGFDLFLHQGFDAFEKFSGLPVNRAVARKAFLKEHPQTR